MKLRIIIKKQLNLIRDVWMASLSKHGSTINVKIDHGEEINNCSLCLEFYIIKFSICWKRALKEAEEDWQKQKTQQPWDFNNNN